MIRLDKIRHRQPNQKPCLQSFVDHVQAAVSGQYLGLTILYRSGMSQTESNQCILIQGVLLLPDASESTVETGNNCH